MNNMLKILLCISLAVAAAPDAVAQGSSEWQQSSLYEVPPRGLVDVPTAGTLPRAY